jgi:lipoprotein signal peptidase
MFPFHKHPTTFSVTYVNYILFYSSRNWLASDELRLNHVQILKTVIKLHVTENEGKAITCGVGRTRC